MNKIKLFLTALAVLVCSSVVFAEKYDIKELTPEVKAALDARKGHFDEIKQLKAEGVLGENNRGYLEVLKNENDAQTLADSENKDRKFIYQTIEEQNNLSDALGTIEKVFAQVQRDKASTGDKIQTESGEWVSK